jgi:hypothetical protein
MRTMWRRREFVLGSLAAGLCPTAQAIGPSSQLDVVELMMGSSTLSRPGAWEKALLQVSMSTSIKVNPRAVQSSPEEPELFAHPFAVLIADGPLPDLTDKAAQMLQRFLSYGGFLFIDDATGSPNGEVTPSVRRLCRRLFPTRSLSPLRGDHSVYRSFFLLKSPMGRVVASDVMEGIQIGEITPLIFCPNDLSGALDRGKNGLDLNPVVPGGEWQRTEALKLAINLFMYSLTSNYKHDQAHVAELLKDGRL